MKPDMTNRTDALAHCLSEIMNNSAPIGWERYRGPANCLLAIFDLHVNPDSSVADRYAAVFPAGIGRRARKE